MVRNRISLAFLVPIILIGCQSTSLQQSNLQGDVASMERVKNYDGLISHYKSQLELGLQDPEMKEKLAWAYFHKGDIESANFYVQHLQKEGVESSSLYQLEGQVLDAKSDTGGAIQAYLSSIKAGNISGQIHVLLGVSYAKLGKYEEAYQELNNARLRGYDDVTIKNNIAMIHIANGEYEQAIETLTPVLIDNPENKVVKANLAIALMKAQQIEEAKKLLKDDFSDQELHSIAVELTQYRG
ncbi:TPA: tetratricopeptide repeat protein [Vibrio parahaemolyticus]|uniref:tetratricopeptide repeat protein n=1 Tax=Vibrio parahaemolyticus TaxID=670 RepID=UPI001121675C|nr:tetratricopeptide repeat protein [Vibrio parahaemolyticus]MDG2632276.1 tetratricopeptide repeat protein [Vibrio parahaemolyticus]TOP03529.1 anaphase-promoting protein [Vibrio parahaemolyticus]HCG7115215.1 tetratricopeptide repeat protein [Vibrio parahaemolyticus]